MSQARQEPIDVAAVPTPAIGGILVVGSEDSGTDLVGGALATMGFSAVAAEGADGGAPPLGALNDRLLAAGTGAGRELPDASPGELARLLRPFAEEARKTMATVHAHGNDSAPWVWADPRLSFLADFWSDTLGIRPAVILVHRDPAAVAAAAAAGGATGDDGPDVLARWDRTNRSAVVLSSEHPSLVVSYDDVAGRTKDVIVEVCDFLNGLGISVPGDAGQAVESVERHLSAQAVPPETRDPGPVAPKYRTMARLLSELEQAGGQADSVEALVGVTAAFYDEDYYSHSCDIAGHLPYTRAEQHWATFFDDVAEELVETVRPTTALDVGCAIGMLVEALRNHGVDATGFDISEWAISQVPSALKPYCRIGSITEEIEGHYDLITCIEVLEHLPPSLADASVGNLCRHAEVVLFSSTPDDFDEPTHLNVQPVGYWAELFLRHGFHRDADADAAFLAPQAVLFRRGERTPGDLVADYERALWSIRSDLGDRLTRISEEHQQLGELHRDLSGRADALQSAHDGLQRDVHRLTIEVANVESRRAAENLASYQLVRRLEAEQRRLAALVDSREVELEAFRNTKTFRYTTKLRSLYGRLRGRRGAPAASGPAQASAPSRLPDGSYERWIELYDTLDAAARQAMALRVQGLPAPPTISVIMPVFDPPPDMLRQAIDSVRRQLYPAWELCIADDCSTDPEVGRVLEDAAASDPRIKVARRAENGHISAASNTALSLATGEWIAPLDHDDLLAEHALAVVALTLADHPDAQLVYSDEDKVDEAGRRSGPYFKPDFDPLLLLGQNFVSHLSVFRRDLVTRVGGYREGYEGSQDWDLTLRVTELVPPSQVVHVPHVLYHWRAHARSTASVVATKPYALDAGRRAVADHLARTGRPARVVRVGRVGHNRVIWDLPDPPPRVSIVIPTRDGRLLQRCVDSVLSFTAYPDFEVLVVDNNSETYPALQFMQASDDRLRVLRDERPFNYGAINNHAVAQTTGEIICLLNDDTEVIAGEWLAEMVSQIVQPGVGAVGAKLCYDEELIQHAGVVLGINGVAGHAHRMFDRVAPGYMSQLLVAHRMSAVTAACMLIRREAWEQIDGFDEVNLPVAFNDVDLCLRVREAGWEIVWTPHAELFHHESTTRGPDDVGPRAEAFAREVAYMETRWGFDQLRQDKYYNPNLSLDAEDYSLAWPPRQPLDRYL